jgi:hypothetical protein
VPWSCALVVVEHRQSAYVDPAARLGQSLDASDVSVGHGLHQSMAMTRSSLDEQGKRPADWPTGRDVRVWSEGARLKRSLCFVFGWRKPRGFESRSLQAFVFCCS